MSNPEVIEADVTVEEHPNDEGDDQVLEMKEMAPSVKIWNESEKSDKINRRQSLLERMRSSKSKSNDSTSEEEEKSVADEEDDIKPLPEELKRKRKKAAEIMKRPSFQKQTSR